MCEFALSSVAVTAVTQCVGLCVWQICSQLSGRLEREQAEAGAEIQLLRVSFGADDTAQSECCC